MPAHQRRIAELLSAMEKSKPFAIRHQLSMPFRSHQRRLAEGAVEVQQVGRQRGRRQQRQVALVQAGVPRVQDPAEIALRIQAPPSFDTAVCG